MNGQVQPTTCAHGIDLLARCDACRENLDVRIIRDAIQKHSLTRLTEDEIRRKWRAYSQETEGVAWLTVSRVWTPAMVSNFLAWSSEAVREARVKKNLQTLRDIEAKRRQELAAASGAAIGPGQAVTIGEKLYLLDPEKYVDIYYKPSPRQRELVEDEQARRTRDVQARIEQLRAIYEDQIRTAAERPIRSVLPKNPYAAIERAAEAIWQSNGPSIGPPRVLAPAAPAVGTGPRRYFDE